MCQRLYKKWSCGHRVILKETPCKDACGTFTEVCQESYDVTCLECYIAADAEFLRITEDDLAPKV